MIRRPAHAAEQELRVIKVGGLVIKWPEQSVQSVLGLGRGAFECRVLLMPETQHLLGTCSRCAGIPCTPHVDRVPCAAEPGRVNVYSHSSAVASCTANVSSHFVCKRVQRAHFACTAIVHHRENYTEWRNFNDLNMYWYKYGSAWVIVHSCYLPCPSPTRIQKPTFQSHRYASNARNPSNAYAALPDKKEK